MDRITIKGLEVFAHHGVFPEETALGQKFIFHITLYLNTRQAGQSDQLERSIHYGEVCHFVQQYAQAHTWKLLESVAEHLSQALLLEYPLLQQVELEIEKPWAPIGLPLQTVSVAVRRGWHTAYVALGSNLGDKQGYLDGAVRQLNQRADCRVVRVSDYLVTKPYGGVEQDDFLNGALELRTLLEPRELLDCLHEIEQAAQRKRTIRWGPRTLDLDILLYDDLVLDEETLQIPHRELHLRDFVLRPMAQIAPWKRHPISGKAMETLLAELHSSQ